MKRYILVSMLLFLVGCAEAPIIADIAQIFDVTSCTKAEEGIEKDGRVCTKMPSVYRWIEVKK